MKSFMKVKAGEVGRRAEITIERVNEIQEKENRDSEERMKKRMIARRNRWRWLPWINLASDEPSRAEVVANIKNDGGLDFIFYPSIRSNEWKKRAWELLTAARYLNEDDDMFISVEDFDKVLNGWGQE